LATAFCPLTRLGELRFVLQTAAEPRFVVDSKVKPVALVGHVKMAFAPEQFRPRRGALTSERLKTAPLPELPPFTVVPYRVLPDKTKLFGPDPLPLVAVQCRLGG
jgi:hypothetical protein